MHKVALVLEGGGFRGVWTSGILDWMLDNNLECEYVIGTSMGACNGACYIAKQKERGLQTNTIFINQKNSMSWRRLITGNNFFDMEFLFRELADEILPFDYDSFYKSPQKLEVVSTNCITGKPKYFKKESHINLADMLQASVSLPLLSNHFLVEGIPYLDGGLSDPIPYKRAFDLGYEKAIIILTRPKNYIKKPVLYQKLMHIKHANYPVLNYKLKSWHETYNKIRTDIFELEKNGKTLILCPNEPISSKRIEKNISKLKQSYTNGYDYASERCSEILEFISG